MKLSGFIAILVIIAFVALFIWLTKKLFNLEPDSIFGAVMEFRYDLIEQYLQTGGDINLTNQFGMTFLMIACDKSRSKYKKFRYAIWNRGNPGDVLKLMDYLIEKGCDVNKLDIDGNTAIFFAAENEERLQILIDNGADLNYQNNKGETALMQAAKQSLLKTENLLKIGANPKIKDYSGKTAVDHAMSVDNKYTAEMISEYINRGMLRPGGQ